jgi:hypothetical protein
MDRILEMSGELADRMHEDQAAGRGVSEDRVRALVKAAMLLEEHGLPWPPRVMQVLQEIDRPTQTSLDELGFDERQDPVDEGRSSDAGGILGRLVSFARRG